MGSIVLGSGEKAEARPPGETELEVGVAAAESRRGEGGTWGQERGAGACFVSRTLCEQGRLQGLEGRSDGVSLGFLGSTTGGCG